MVHMGTYHKQLVDRYSRLSCIIELDTALAQHSHREFRSERRQRATIATGSAADAIERGVETGEMAARRVGLREGQSQPDTDEYHTPFARHEPETVSR
ncbi:unnamed protein product [Nesidiocoris tenuis]|uniref:Uncharacterized protein n=1 Tax=Nesidiocoris tenuis TaxID=355587 RepID=A0A6H5GXY8_9HEMI|nr:unnamed protein product [Nesidiocoris tenuis]